MFGVSNCPPLTLITLGLASQYFRLASGLVYLSGLELKFQSTFLVACYIALWKDCYLDIDDPYIERNVSLQTVKKTRYV